MIKIISNKDKLTAGILALGAILFFSILVSGADAGQKPVRVIVTFEEGVYTTPASQQALASRFGGQVELPLAFMNAVALSLPNEASANSLAHLQGVASVDEDVEMSLVKKPEGTPGGGNGGGGDSDPVPPEEIDWGVDLIEANLAWDTQTGSGIKVAILDTGIDADHPDLVDNVMPGISFVGGREKWNNDANGHGSHVAGTIASVDNELGYVGVAPQADLYAVQVLNRRGSGNLSGLVSGLNWAVNEGVDVISMSLSFPTGNTIDGLTGLQAALDAAETAGIVVVAAAGNSGEEEVPYPAQYPTVLAIGATANTNDNLASYSNWGSRVDIAAPGSNITSTWKNGGYKTISGTSMATPHVAGVVALVLEQGVTDANSNGIADEARAQIIAAGTHPVVGSYTFGRIDAMTALGL